MLIIQNCLLSKSSKMNTLLVLVINPLLVINGNKWRFSKIPINYCHPLLEITSHKFEWGYSQIIQKLLMKSMGKPILGNLQIHVT